MSRLFVAAWPSTELADLLAKLPRNERPGQRWTSPQQWHITLRFLGDVDEDAAIEAVSSVRAAPVRAVAGPEVELLGDSIVVVPVAGLDRLAAAVREATASVEEPVERHSFSGHLTLGRVKGVDCRLVGTPISAEFLAEEMTLVRSDLHPDGARYVSVMTHRLLPARD